MNKIIEKYFKQYTIKALLISDILNVRYLSGFTGSTAMLLITAQKKFFFSDFRYMTQAKQQVKGFKIIEVTRDSTASIAKELSKLNLKKLGFESGAVTYAQYAYIEKGLKKITLVPIKEDPSYIRIIKARLEITKIKKAIHVNKKAFDKILPLIKPGKTERFIADQLERAIRSSGGDKLSFDTIVASGYRGALPHGLASNKKIKRGELITIDFGNVVDGYCSDETCTIGIGKLTGKQKEIYQIVKDAHDFAVEKMRPGMKGKKIDAYARDYIEKKGYGKFFGHSLGHGIGLAVHERPMLSHLSEDIIEEDMVFSVEPGIYIPKWGGVRIEDLAVCTPRGGKVITEINKNLKVLHV